MPLSRRELFAAMAMSAAGSPPGRVGRSVDGNPRVIDVTAVGARGDGRTDDAPVFNAALGSLAAAGGGILVIPPGEYNLGRPLQFPGSGVEMIGAGRQATVLRPIRRMPAAITVGSTTTPSYRWAIRHLRIDDRLGVADIGILLGYAREGILEEVWVSRGCRQGGVVLQGTSEAGNWTDRLVRCVVTHGAGDGVVVGAQSNALLLEGCHFARCAGTHLRIAQATGVRVLACQFEQAGSGVEITIDLSEPWSRVAGLDISDGYFELLRNEPSARALALRGRGRWPMMGVIFSRNYVWGGATAQYAVDLVVPAGGLFGALVHNTLVGVTAAGYRCGDGVGRGELEVKGGWASRSLGGAADLPLTAT